MLHNKLLGLLRRCQLTRCACWQDVRGRFKDWLIDTQRYLSQGNNDVAWNTHKLRMSFCVVVQRITEEW